MTKMIGVGLWLLPAVAFAQSPFDGTWKTDFAASKLSSKPYVYSVNKGIYDCDSCAPKINNVKADGTDQPVTGQSYDTVAVQVTDANTVHVITKKAGKTTADSTRSVSADGKSMTISMTNFPAGGAPPVKGEAKLTRISKGSDGSHATSGSWKIQKLSEDAPALTSTWKASADGLSVSSPTDVSWDAKFDGQEVPVKGIYATETVSLKKLGDRSLQATYKRDGKLYSVETVTVSADGAKKTTVVDNKWSGRHSTYVDDKQ
jgi:hypothetical protein